MTVFHNLLPGSQLARRRRCSAFPALSRRSQNAMSSQYLKLSSGASVGFPMGKQSVA